jgi:hypothetical protein
MGFLQRGPINIYCDSQDSIAITKNPEFHARTKHIKNKNYFIHGIVKLKEIEFFYLKTSQNPSDMFTKNLPRLKFEFCMEKMEVHSITP